MNSQNSPSGMYVPYINYQTTARFALPEITSVVGHSLSAVTRNASWVSGIFDLRSAGGVVPFALSPQVCELEPSEFEPFTDEVGRFESGVFPWLEPNPSDGVGPEKSSPVA